MRSPTPPVDRSRRATRTSRAPTRCPRAARVPPAEAEARAGLAVIAAESGRGGGRLHVDLVSALANALFLQDRPVEGADAVRAAEPRLLRLDDRPREIEHYTNLGVLLDAANQHAEAQAATRHGIALARAQGDRIGELVLLNNLAFSLHDVGRVAAALEPLREALPAEADVPGAAHRRPVRPGAARQHAPQPRRLCRGARAPQTGLGVVGAYSPVFAAGAHNSLAHLYLDLGQPARSQQHLQPGARRSTPAPPVIPRHQPSAACPLGAGAGRSRGLAAEALQAAQGFIIASTRYAVRGQAALLGARLLEPEAAYRAATAVAREAGRLQMQGLRMTALACGRAPCARLRARRRRRSAHALEALALWPEHAPDDVYIAEVWLAAVDASMRPAIRAPGRAADRRRLDRSDRPRPRAGAVSRIVPAPQWRQPCLDGARGAAERSGAANS